MKSVLNCSWMRCRFTFLASMSALLLIAGMLPAIAAKESNVAQADELFSGSYVPHLVIEIPEAEMEALKDYTERRKKQRATPRTNVLVTIREGLRVYKDVGLHLKGSGSFQTIDRKPALTLSFDERHDKQRFHGLQKISLNNSTHDPSFLCEKLGRDMFVAAGVPVPRVTHAKVELNGRDVGLYVLAEGWNKQFLKRHFTDPSGNLYERVSIGGKDLDGYEKMKVSNPSEDHQAMAALVVAMREPNLEERWAALQRTLDVERFITLMAMEIMLGHWDGYCRNQNNFRIFHDRTAGRMVFMPHGMDQLFGLRRAINDIPVLPQMRGRLATAVLETDEGRRRYVERMTELRKTLFNVAAMTNRVVQLSERLGPLIAEGDFEAKGHEEQIGRLLQRIPERYDLVGEQLAELQTTLRPGERKVVEFSRWDFARENSGPRFDRRGQSGSEVFQINGVRSSSDVTGSWRATYLLEPGNYRFEARALGTNLVTGAGVLSLRTSVSRSATTYSNASEWITLTNEFSLPAKRYVELICEYQGRGTGVYDPSSLILTRLERSFRPSAPKKGALERR